jgi:hypothetical protein
LGHFRWLGVSALSLFDLIEYLCRKLNVFRLKIKAKTTTEVQAFESESVANNNMKLT